MLDGNDARVAVDIGGTFTDVAVETASGHVAAKTPTTPADPVQGGREGIRLALQRAGLGPSEIRAVIHGTTLATNALIERKGAKVGLITTHGFQDILEIAYERRYDLYDLGVEKPDVLVPRNRCYTVSERIGARGEVLQPLQEDELEGIVTALERDGVESVAVGLLHSYVNDAHERRLRELLRARMPDLWISLSSEVSPELREYDRLCTTVADAYVKPLMARYIRDFERALREDGFTCPLFLMTSGGGMTTIETAVEFPIRLVESGPSGGAILAATLARQLDLQEVVSFDMGGTTAKVCLIDDGEPQSSRHFEIARASRFIKGSGLPVRIPVIEMIEIGAGGGSIATVDKLQRITVGPESAGADPGPASYGRDGEHATVTDADAALGYLDPEAFAEGRLHLHLDRAEGVIERDIARPLGLPNKSAANGICQMVEENMANAARAHAVERGKGLEGRTLIAFGGNGPLHVARLAEKLGVTRIIIPPDPGVGSAVGFLQAPVSHEIVRSLHTQLGEVDPADINELLGSMEHTANALVRLGAPDAELDTRRSAFMRYTGQGHEIEVPVPKGEFTDQEVAQLRQHYEHRYAAAYGRHVPDMDIEIMNWAVVVSTRVSPVPPPTKTGARRTPSPSRSRPVHLGRSNEPVDVPSFQRTSLEPGDEIEGPALIVEPQTTTFVSPQFNAQVDGASNLVLTLRNGPGS